MEQMAQMEQLKALLAKKLGMDPSIAQGLSPDAMYAAEQPSPQETAQDPDMPSGPVPTYQVQPSPNGLSYQDLSQLEDLTNQGEAMGGMSPDVAPTSFEDAVASGDQNEPIYKNKKLLELLSRSLGKSMDQSSMSAQEYADMYDAKKNSSPGEDLRKTNFDRAATMFWSGADLPTNQLAAKLKNLSEPTAEERRKEDLRKLLKEKIAAENINSDNASSLLAKMMDAAKPSQSLGSPLGYANLDERTYQNTKADYLEPMKKLSEFQQQYNTVKAAVDRGQVADVETIKSFLARMMGETGALGVADVARNVPSNLKTQIAKFMAAFKANPEKAPMPPEVLSWMNTNIDALKEAYEKKFTQNLQTINRLHKAGPGSSGAISDKMYAETLKMIPKKQFKAITESEYKKLSPEKQIEYDKAFEENEEGRQNGR